MFYFTLAKELGMTVEHMLDAISSEELTYWAAYFILEKEQQETEQRKSNVKSQVRK